jgi:amidase
MTDAAFRPARELLAELDRGSTTSETLVGACLARIDRLNPGLCAVVHVDREGALARARAADAELRSGRRRGVLHGLPITVKDSFEVAGMPATCGAEALRDHRPARDAGAVARLLAAGAIVVGKTNVPTWSLDLQTFNTMFGTTRNPWHPARTPGGSSGGAAAALAAGLVPAEIGTDLAGSLRIPAHWCGVAALKPTYGRVPVDGTLSGPPGRLRTPDLLVAGPMARTVGDLELLLGVLAPDIPPAPPLHPPLRVAVWDTVALCPADGDTRDVIAGVATALAAAGHAVDAAARPALDPAEAFRLFLQLLYGEMSASFPEPVYRSLRNAARGGPGDPWTPLTMMAWGAAQSHRDWLAAVEAREQLRLAWEQFFAGVDVLLAPVAPTPAPLHDPRPFEERTVTLGGRDYPYMQQSFWAGLATTVGLPAVVVPAGLTPAGLPVGVQLIGTWGGEGALLGAARVVEALTGGFRPPPGF